MNDNITKTFYILLGIILAIISYYSLIIKDILVIETNISKSGLCIKHS